MKRLVQTTFARRMRDVSWRQAGGDIAAWERAYDRFVHKLHVETSSSKDRSEILAILYYTRVEFATYEKMIISEQTESVSLFLQKALLSIDKQISWVERQLLAEQSLTNSSSTGRSSEEKPLRWTGSVVDWVELLYSLHAVGSFNHGKISLKALFEIMGKIFDFEVKEFSNYYMNIKSRTCGKRTKFMDRLKGALQAKMEEADCKPSRK